MYSSLSIPGHVLVDLSSCSPTGSARELLPLYLGATVQIPLCWLFVEYLAVLWVSEVFNVKDSSRLEYCILVNLCPRSCEYSAKCGLVNANVNT